MTALPPPPKPPAFPPRPDEATRLAELKVMKRMATGLLVVALIIFVVARVLEPAYPWLGFIRATAEASLVGGLADWFAVTALFRKPLGLPIPHTAIIQTQKDRIGRILGNFVQNHFLAREILLRRLQAMQLGTRIATWLSGPENSERLAKHLASGAVKIVQHLPEHEVRELIRDSAVARIQQVPVAPVLGNVLSAVAAEHRHQQLLDEALRMVRDTLERNREELQQKIRDESPWWVPGAVDKAFHRKIEAAAQKLVEDVAADPYHPLRIKFDAAFKGFIERLRSSQELNARAEKIKADLLAKPEVDAFAASLWDKAKAAVERFGDGDTAKREPLARGIATVGHSLLEQPERMAELDNFLTEFLASAVEQHRQEVADLIADTVSRWDPDVAAARIELAVGRDLQFIRLNGTLVGGLAGLVIYTVTMLLER
jgi:uncharacterized membrane-anchored protein YjiN (DUF445 family)